MTVNLPLHWTGVGVPLLWQLVEPHERFASARAASDAQGDVGVSDRIEEGSCLDPNVDLLDVCHQRPDTAENEGFGPPFFAFISPT